MGLGASTWAILSFAFPSSLAWSWIRSGQPELNVHEMLALQWQLNLLLHNAGLDSFFFFFKLNTKTSCTQTQIPCIFFFRTLPLEKEIQLAYVKEKGCKTTGVEDQKNAGCRSLHCSCEGPGRHFQCCPVCTISHNQQPCSQPGILCGFYSINLAVSLNFIFSFCLSSLN